MTTASPFPRFHVAAAEPFERGRQLGSQAVEYIRGSIRVYEETFEHYAGLSWPEVRQLAGRFLAPIARYDASIAAELEGLAAGARLPLEDILAINARTEIMFGLSVLPPAECTTFFVGPPASANGHALLGQNWDWRTRTRGTTVLVELDQGSEPSLLMLAEAGLIGKLGFNSAGLGVAANALVSELDQGTPGVPFHVILRRILNSRTLAEAAQAVTTADRAASANYLIATAAGEAVDIEAAPGGEGHAFATRPIDGVITHANNFECAIPFMDVGLRDWRDSPVRSRTLRRMLEERRGAVDIASLTELLQDHTCHPDSICRHPDSARHEVERSSTVASWIIDLTQSFAKLCAGPPCAGVYQDVRPAFGRGGR